MPFNIVSYIDSLQRSLERLQLQERIAFAVWCADALFREVSYYLAAKTDVTQSSAVQEALDYLWKCASGDKPVDTEVRRLERACGEIGWAEEDVVENEQAMNFYAIEAINSLMHALETCRTGSTLSAAKAAESVINKLDRQLSEELFVDSYSEAIWSDARWKGELERQQKMLDFLRDCPGLKPEQKMLFSE
jgi:hypothetical protein